MAFVGSLGVNWSKIRRLEKPESPNSEISAKSAIQPQILISPLILINHSGDHSDHKASSIVVSQSINFTFHHHHSIQFTCNTLKMAHSSLFLVIASLLIAICTVGADNSKVSKVSIVTV